MRSLVAASCCLLAACSGTDDAQPGGSSDGGSSDGGSSDGGDGGSSSGCEFDTSSWRHTAPVLIDLADADGLFSYDPPGVEIVLREGSWDADSGEIEVTDTYVTGHKYLSAQHVGVAEVQANGNYTHSYTSETLDVLGQVSEFERVLVQQGCELTATVTNLGDPGSYAESYTWFATVVSDEQLDQHLETTWQDLAWVEDRVSTSDLRTTYTIDIGEGDYVVSGTYQPDGSHERRMVQDGEKARYDSTYLWQIDGSYHLYRESWSQSSHQLLWTLDAVYQYDGSAVGTYTEHGEDGDNPCTYQRDATLDEDCGYRYECDDGSIYEGSC